MISTSQRAAPLPPEERRASLIESTLSLILDHGPAVNTRQIAQAAGVAEGTIFRVFATKDELVDAAVASAFDPAPMVRELDAIDRSSPLEARLATAVRVLQRRAARVFRLADALGATGPAVAHHHRQACADESVTVQRALADLISPDRVLLRCEPYETARRLQLLTVACSHPRLTEGDPLPPEEIARMLLHGILVPEHAACRPAPSGASGEEVPC
ncbi:TetR/AcrR family transcriptional regulator [Streptosporangium pseudovulgare]|uniref:TetR family transcriptional regulator n=1 Tax=Streptosporangium pseudovulgare TaxID=35765 RepID=A0ABQ2QQ44_9ACTN|nr:TetR/AcrR family transcriptional regulator [Streptosporangium pseudovulgare]GGP91470.1 TetR family transcriptional regulator [Streptosporangium pseudovulgare]